MRMNQPNNEDLDAADHAVVLGRMPRGRYLLTASYGGTRHGLLVERVQHCADEPPTISISVRKGHVLSPLIRDAARFGLSELAPHDRILTRLFGRPAELIDDDPFLGHDLVSLAESHDVPIPRCAASWVSCELLRHLDIESDHELYIGRVMAAGMLPAAFTGNGKVREAIPGRHEQTSPGDPAEEASVKRAGTATKRATA